MEKLKEPEMFLSVANSAGLIAVTGYFYKQLELIRQNQVGMAKALTVSLKKLETLEKLNQGKSDVIKDISSQVKNIADQMVAIEDDVNLDLDEIIHTLEKNKINVERQDGCFM